MIHFFYNLNQSASASLAAVHKIHIILGVYTTVESCLIILLVQQTLICISAIQWNYLSQMLN